MVDRERTSRRLLWRLEHLGSSEALAATALLLREAQAKDHESLAYQCAQSFWVILLLIDFGMPTRATEALRADAARYLDFERDAFVRWKALDYIPGRMGQTVVHGRLGCLHG
jgi:hypothetical protein